MDGDNNNAGTAKAFEVKFCDFCHMAIALGHNNSPYSQTVCNSCDGPLAYLYARYAEEQEKKQVTALKRFLCSNCQRSAHFKHTTEPPVKRASGTYVVMCTRCSGISHTKELTGIMSYE